MRGKEPACPRGADGAGFVCSFYREAVIRKLRRAGIPDDDVEDLAQSVFLAFCARAPKGAPSALRRWLCDAARKHAANYRQRHRHHYEVLVDSQELDQSPAPGPATDERYQRAHLAALIDALPGELPAVVRLHIEGHALSEVAEALGLPKSGAHYRLERAVSMLRARAKAGGLADGQP